MVSDRMKELIYRDDALKILNDLVFYSHDPGDCSVVREFCRIFAEKIRGIRPVGWTPMSERCPEVSWDEDREGFFSEVVLLELEDEEKNEIIKPGYLNAGCNVFEYWGYDGIYPVARADEVIAWMPLPDYYIEGEEDD